jgi:two-component system, OmpR family, response regulator RpaA
VTKANGGRDLTTGECAKIFGVAPRTVSKWFDRGVLRGYRLPGSQDRRIPRTSAVAFARQHGCEAALEALDPPAPPQPVVFLAGLPDALVGQLLPLPEGADVRQGGVFEAGCFSVAPPPGSSAVVDCSLGRGACLMAALQLTISGVRVIGLAAEDDGATADWTRAGCVEVLRHPVDPAELARLLKGAS